MLNSFTYNSVKYNSLLVRQIVEEPKKGGGKKRKEREFRKEIFNLIGQKLFFCQEDWNIIARILIEEDASFMFSRKVSHPLQQRYEIFAKGLKADQIDFSVKAQRLVPTKRFFSINAKRLINFNEKHRLNGKRLTNSIFYKEIAGKKKVFTNNETHVKGKKDIAHVLTLLDLFDE